MHQYQYKKLALMGLLSGLLASQQSFADAQTKSNATQPAAKQNSSQTQEPATTSPSNPNEGNLGYHLMTEDELTLELSPKGIELYNGLDAEGKQLALEVASQRCDHSNQCKGLNACQDDTHACAGKGTCKGTSKCALSDKNLAVKLVSDYMAKKRAQATQATAPSRTP